MLLAGGDDIVVGGWLLEDEPHALNVIAGIAPVAHGRQVAEGEALLLALRDACGRESDLAGDECLATSFALVIEKYSRAAIHAVGFAIFLYDPKSVEFGDGVGTVGVERGVFVLGYVLDFSVEFGGGSLIYAACVGEAGHAHCLEDAEHAGGVDIGGVFGRVERDLYVALCCEVVDFVGAHFRHDLHDRHRVAHVAVVEVEAGMSLEMGNALSVIDRRAAYHAVDFIVFREQQLGKK